MPFSSRYTILALCLSMLLFATCQSTRSGGGSPELTKHSLQWAGLERTYYVYTPTGEQHTGPLPVLFHLHGGGGNGPGNMRLTYNRFNELADRDGFIIVYPEAVDKNWNDGRSSDRVRAWREDIDDVGFIVAVLDRVASTHSIDRERVFSVGMSNGGFMTSRLLCDRADIFRGGAILTATLSRDYLPQCEPSKAVGVLVMNGTEDELVPYDGGEVRVLSQSRGNIISTDELVDFWRERNACQATAHPIDFPDQEDDGTTVRVQGYTDCAPGGALILYTIEGGGHTWPGGRQYLGEGMIGKTSREIVACDVVWAFFEGL